MYQARKKYPSCKFFKSVELALKNDFDGYIIATPVVSHYNIAKALEDKNIEFKEVQNDSFKVDIKDTLPSAKERTDKVDFNFYVYRVGAFGNQTTISKLVKSYNNEGFPAFTEQNQSNKDLTNILVGPFASKRDIENNKQKLNKIADIKAGEVIAWNP